jgi:hypothetical protein
MAINSVVVHVLINPILEFFGNAARSYMRGTPNIGLTVILIDDASPDPTISENRYGLMGEFFAERVSQNRISK